LDPKALVVPDAVVNMIPPRPSGYEFTRELFRKRTGFAFDALAPAETAADLPLSFLFNSERLVRMLQYETANNGLGISAMINVILQKTWKSPRRTGIEKLIQFQTEQIVLTYLLASGIDNNSSFQVKAVIQKALKDLKTYIETQKKLSKDESYLAHLDYALERMKAPEKAVPTLHRTIPPGAPIGMCE
jgi:hypothetical protein